MRVQSSDITRTSEQVRILYHILFWMALYVLDVVIFGFGYENVDGFVKLALAEVPPQVLLAYAIMYWIIPQYVARKLFFESVVFIVIAFIISGLIGHFLFIAFNLYANELGPWNLPKIFVRAFYAFLHASIAIAIKLVKLV